MSSMERMSWNQSLASTRSKAWIDAWKEEGSLRGVLHKAGPAIRHVHSFRVVEVVEGRDKVERQIKWFPFVCWEGDAFRDALTEWIFAHKKGRKIPVLPAPRICPACKVLHHLSQRHDIESTTPIWTFESKRENRAMEKADALGIGERKDSYKDDLTPQFELVIPMIVPTDPSVVKITNEKRSLAKALEKRIRADVAEYGEDEGSPSNAPLLYLFTYEKGDNNPFQVATVDRSKGQGKIGDEVWEKMVARWSDDEGVLETLERACRRGPARKLLAAMTEHADPELGIPFADLFADALAESGEEEDEADEETDDAPVPSKTGKDALATARSPEKTTKAKTTKEEAPEEKAPPEKAPRSRAGKQPPKVAPPPPPPPDAPVCEDCGTIWPEDVAICPGCGATDEDSHDDADGVEKTAPPAKGKTPWS